MRPILQQCLQMRLSREWPLVESDSCFQELKKNIFSKQFQLPVSTCDFVTPYVLIMSRLSLDSPTLCSCLFFTTFPRSFSPAYSCSDLSCSLLSNGSMATQKDVADPSEEKLLGLEACQLQILGLETFGELREAKMMRLRQNGVRGRERSPRYWHKKRYTKWLESAELRLVPIFLAEMCLTDEIPRKYPHCG